MKEFSFDFLFIFLLGKRVVGEDGVNDAWHENQMLNSELQSLRTRVKALSETVEALTAKNVLLLAEKAAGQWVSSTGGNPEVTSLVQAYVQEIEELRARLLEAEAMYQQLKKRQMQVNKRLHIKLIYLQLFCIKSVLYYDFNLHRLMQQILMVTLGTYFIVIQHQY